MVFSKCGLLQGPKTRGIRFPFVCACYNAGTRKSIAPKRAASLRQTTITLPDRMDTLITTFESKASLPLLVAAAAFSFSCDPALAFELHGEPSNALSLPTWAVHTSSVIEWVTAMGLMWKYAQVTGNDTWKGMTWGMLPCMGSALCACTWHFFYNAPELEVSVDGKFLANFKAEKTSVPCERYFL